MGTAKYRQVVTDGIAAVRHRLSAVAAAIAIAAFVTCANQASAGLLSGDQDFKLMAWQGFAQAIDGPHPEGTPLVLHYLKLVAVVAANMGDVFPELRRQSAQEICGHSAINQTIKVCLHKSCV